MAAMQLPIEGLAVAQRISLGEPTDGRAAGRFSTVVGRSVGRLPRWLAVCHVMSGLALCAWQAQAQATSDMNTDRYYKFIVPHSIERI